MDQQKEKSVKKEGQTPQSLSQWQLMWRKFKRHKLAMLGSTVLIIFYIIVLFVEFFAPMDPISRNSKYPFAPPQRVRFVDSEGNYYFRPFVYGLDRSIDPDTFRRVYETNEEDIQHLYFFVRNEEKYDVLMGLFETSLDFIGLEDGGKFFLLGTDNLGRDMLSRIIYGTRISMSIGLVGVFISLILGLLIGGISGFFGGIIDEAIQRCVEVLISIPRIPLWMALSAAIPQDWTPIQVYFAIVVVLSLIGWTGIARVVRGKFLSLRETDFVLAAQAMGASDIYIIVRHMIPNFMSWVLVRLTIGIPAMIIGETSLSFLGIGLRPPVVSWGVLLQQAQNMRTVALRPWLLLPGLFVVIAVLAFNFAGDGMRDAADPYSN